MKGAIDKATWADPPGRPGAVCPEKYGTHSSDHLPLPVVQKRLWAADSSGRSTRSFDKPFEVSMS